MNSVVEKETGSVKEIVHIVDNTFLLRKDNIAFSVSGYSINDVLDRETEYVNFLQRFGKIYSRRTNEIPLELTIVLSGNCNLRCVYCYSDANEKKSTKCNLEAIKDAVQLVINNRVVLSKIGKSRELPKIKIRFTGGGEPTCNWSSLVDIVDYINEKHSSSRKYINLVLQTNGQVSEKQADYICDNFDDVILSCDGAFDIQDKQRPRRDGESSWKYVQSFLERMQQKRTMCFVRTTVTSYNIAHLEETFAFLLGKYDCIKHVSFAPIEQIGRAEENVEYMLSKDEYAAVMESLKNRFGTKVKSSLFDSVFLHSNYCDAYTGKHLIISPSGNMVKCFLESTNLQIRREDISYYYIDGRFVKNSSQIDNVVPNKCFECIAYYNCFGGCPKLYPRNECDFTSQEGRDWCSLQKELFLRKIKEKMTDKKVICLGVNKLGISKMALLGRE